MICDQNILTNWKAKMYTGKLVLAPMVRSGELPTRLMALKYGADLVWTPEIIDKKIIKCERVENTKTGTIDFLEILGNNKKPKFPGYSNLVLRTFPEKERGKLIFQMGTANAELAVQAAKIVAADVDGIDVNAGCPKPFLTHAGMGAALLSTPDLLESILKSLVTEVGTIFKIPISVKIRLMSDKDAAPTVALINRLCKTGITNLTLHCRTRDMRNRELPIRGFLPEIISTCKSHNVSFIINGAIRNRYEYELLQAEYGSEVGGMIAEAAESNPTCFSKKPLPWGKVVKEFVETAMVFDNFPGNTKYIILNQIPGKLPYYQKIAQCKTHEAMMSVITSIEEDKKSKVVQKYLQKAFYVDAASPNTLIAEELANEAEEREKLQHRKEEANSGNNEIEDGIGKRVLEDKETVTTKKQRVEVVA